MKSDAHTPGPWEVWPEVDGGVGADRHLVYISVGPVDKRKRVTSISVYGDRRDGLPRSRTPNVPEGECRANARLIAAAPDLLEALLALANAADDVGVQFFDTDTMHPVVERMQAATLAARAAIAKAEGA